MRVRHYTLLTYAERSSSVQKYWEPAKFQDSIQIQIGRFRFDSKVTGWLEIFESAAPAVVPQTMLTVQQITSTVVSL